MAFLRDGLEPNAAAPIDPTQPLYLVELGAGPGRFAFHFLKQFLRLLDQAGLGSLPFKYVMTDFVGPTIDFWSRHPQLKPFVERGILDFAHFDASQPQPLRLLHSAALLDQGALANPLVLVANYFFDAVPQDVFYLHQGKLHEGRVTVTSAQAEPNLEDPTLLSRVVVGYDHQLLAADPYEDGAFNRILNEYSQRLGDTTILFPFAALQCVRFFRGLSGDRLLVLAADKGFHWEEDLLRWGEPQMAIHDGCFSLPLNFHAMGQYILQQGGQVLQTPHHHPSLDILAFLLGRPAPGYRETTGFGNPSGFSSRPSRNSAPTISSSCSAASKAVGWHTHTKA